MSEQYELTTISDIFDKVPANRIKECCRELGLLLAQTKALSELVGATANTSPLCIKFPIVWTDDGAGEIVTEVHAGGMEMLRMETKLPIAHQEPK